MIPPRVVFVRMLADRVPELRPLLDEHEAFYEEILAHVLFGDYARWFDQTVGLNAPKSQAALFARVVEQALAIGDLDVQEVIVVSFIENLDNLRAALPYFGPHLKAAAVPYLY